MSSKIVLKSLIEGSSMGTRNDEELMDMFSLADMILFSFEDDLRGICTEEIHTLQNAARPSGQEVYDVVQLSFCAYLQTMTSTLSYVMAQKYMDLCEKDHGFRDNFLPVVAKGLSNTELPELTEAQVLEGMLSMTESELAYTLRSYAEHIIYSMVQEVAQRFNEFSESEEQQSSSIDC